MGAKDGAGTAVVVVNDSAAVLQVIERTASNKNVDIHKLEKLLDMQERIMNKNAEMAFNRDMALMQAQLPTITERGEIKVNDVVRSKYARFEDINEAVKPALQRHGFAINFKTDTTGGTVKVTGILTHREGHRETTDMTLPVDISGSKNPVQAIGSSVSYGKRYVMEALLNLTSRGQDDDAQSAMGAGEFGGFEQEIDAVETKAQAEALWKRIAAACKKSGDKEAYGSLKAKITKRANALKAAA